MKNFDNREFKLGWKILILATVGVATSSSSLLLYSFSAMMIPLELAMGWGRSELQAAITALSLGTIVAAQLAGWVNLKFGLRIVTIVSLIALSVSLFLLTQIQTTIWSLYLGYFLVPLAGLGTLQITWSHLVNLWFVENRGLALAIILSGSGLAAALLPLLITWSVPSWGWQTGFISLSVLPVAIALPLTLRWLMPVSSRNGAKAAEQPKAQQESGGGILLSEALRSWRFWVCNLSMTLVVACVVGLVTNIIPLLQDRGLSAVEAGQIFSAFGISLILGRLVVGYLIDRLWAPGVAAVALMMPALACLIFAMATNNTALYILATLLVGIGAGAEFDIAAFLIARYFGMRDYGRLFGIHLGLITAGAAAAPLLFGALYSLTGDYSGLLTFSTACFIIGPLMLLSLGSYPVFRHPTALTPAL